MISVPIKTNGQVVKTLVIGERLLGFELGKDLLFMILVICTILGGLICSGANGYQIL